MTQPQKHSVSGHFHSRFQIPKGEKSYQATLAQEETSPSTAVLSPGCTLEYPGEFLKHTISWASFTISRNWISGREGLGELRTLFRLWEAVLSPHCPHRGWQPSYQTNWKHSWQNLRVRVLHWLCTFRLHKLIKASLFLKLIHVGSSLVYKMQHLNQQNPDLKNEALSLTCIIAMKSQPTSSSTFFKCPVYFQACPECNRWYQ